MVDRRDFYGDMLATLDARLFDVSTQHVAGAHNIENLPNDKSLMQPYELRAILPLRVLAKCEAMASELLAQQPGLIEKTLRWTLWELELRPRQL